MSELYDRIVMLEKQISSDRAALEKSEQRLMKLKLDQQASYERQAEILSPFLGTIGTCGYFAAKAKAGQDGK